MKYLSCPFSENCKIGKGNIFHTVMLYKKFVARVRGNYFFRPARRAFLIFESVRAKIKYLC